MDIRRTRSAASSRRSARNRSPCRNADRRRRRQPSGRLHRRHQQHDAGGRRRADSLRDLCRRCSRHPHATRSQSAAHALRYRDELPTTLEEVGKQFDVTRERIRRSKPRRCASCVIRNRAERLQVSSPKRKTFGDEAKENGPSGPFFCRDLSRPRFSNQAICGGVRPFVVTLSNHDRRNPRRANDGNAIISPVVGPSSVGQSEDS